MYRVVMDQRARDDIAAAAAVHRELGRDYDAAVAEGLIERIGDEIDKRVDARFASNDRGSRLPANPNRLDQRCALWTGAAIGVLAAGGTAMVAIGQVNHYARHWAAVWIVMVLVCVRAFWLRRQRDR
jgi:hypothetical protein